MPHPAGPSASSRSWAAGPVYMLVLLTLINAFNYLDRTLFGLVLPLIKDDLGLSDTALGLASGLAFAVVYSTLGVPIARLADRTNRRNIIAIGLTVWSAATAMTGFVVNIWQIALTRILLGAGEASSIGPSNSLVCDLFSKAARPFAVSVLSTGAAISALFLIPLAGWISSVYGWRAVFIAAGAPGLLLALLLVLTTREPARRDVDAGAPTPGFFESLRRLCRSRAFVMIAIGECFLAINVYGIATWISSFLVRVHGLDILEIGAILGPLRGVAGIAGALLGGFLAVRLSMRDGRWRLWLPAVATGVILPIQLAFLFTDSLNLALAGIFLVSMMFLVQQPPVFAVSLGIAPPHMRASVIALLMLFSNLTGQTFGPLMVGFLNDALAGLYGDQAIRYSLGVCAVAALGASLMLYLGARDPALRESQDSEAAPSAGPGGG